MKKTHSVSLADALFGKTKKSALGILFSKPERSLHLRELARLSGVSAPMIGKEMDTLCAAGIVLEKRDGNRRVFQANLACPIFEEIRGIARKTAGIADVLREALDSVDGVKLAFIFGSVATGEERADSDVDVCIVGTASFGAVLNALSERTSSIGRTINPVVYSSEEFTKKAQSSNPFVSNLLRSKRVFLVGDEHDFKCQLGEPYAVGTASQARSHAGRNPVSHRKSKKPHGLRNRSEYDGDPIDVTQGLVDDLIAAVDNVRQEVDAAFRAWSRTAPAAPAVTRNRRGK
jgi:predicted nucleotidyltransferase